MVLFGRPGWWQVVLTKGVEIPPHVLSGRKRMNDKTNLVIKYQEPGPITKHTWLLSVAWVVSLNIVLNLVVWIAILYPFAEHEPAYHFYPGQKVDVVIFVAATASALVGLTVTTCIYIPVTTKHFRQKSNRRLRYQTDSQIARQILVSAGVWAVELSIQYLSGTNAAVGVAIGVVVVFVICFVVIPISLLSIPSK